MATETKTTSTLNDLIEINNDRTAGFEKALKDLKEDNSDLKGLFTEYASQSRGFSTILSGIVANSGGEAETGTSVSGSLHRAWIDTKSIFGGNDRESILSEAERGEDAIKKAYSDALSEGELDSNVYQTVQKQSLEINAAHDRIKALRNDA